MPHSLFYGSPISANKFPRYSDNELRRDLDRASLDDATRIAIETELARRANARRCRRQR